MAHGIGAGEDFPRRVHELTDGFGADAVLITAATESDEVVRQAMQACRKKGRVVLVGDVGLHLQRADMYEKELDFLISTSYGPGRYDDVYELEGQDYPIGYVRWTENRNMEEYLRLLADGRVSLEGLGQETYPGRRGGRRRTRRSKSSESKPLLVLLSYPEREDAGDADDAAADARAEAGEARRRARRRRQPSRRRSTCRTWSSCASTTSCAR